MRAALASALATLAGAAGCNLGVALDTGADADMIVAGAQFYPGPPPAGDAAATKVTSVASPNNTIHPGEINKRLGGTVESTARSVALYFAGDVGYWVIPVGLTDPSNPPDLDFDVRINFARVLDAGMRDVQVQATNADGAFGPPNPATLLVAPAVIPASTLDVQLTWDVDADVDLHVTQPDGVTIWARNINSYDPPGPGQPPGDPTTGGILDVDSNSSCVIDGRREENVYWTVAPPHGHYVVKVDTWSLCAQAGARWHVTASLGGQVLAQASGTAIDTDTRFAKDAAAGVLALEFDVP
jgi:hypothetical protein